MSDLIRDLWSSSANRGFLMRLFATLAAAAIALAGLAGQSRAGLFELPFDQITRNRDCTAVPCRDNGLAYRQAYVRDRYLRFDIHTRPAKYALRRVKVMVAPPGIVAAGDHWDRRGRDGLDLVELPAGPYKVVRPAQYEWVTENVLVRPAQNYVTRRHPYYAYYPDTIVVSQP
jgi:hypothetical protein